jgi:hypothetical protein
MPAQNDVIAALVQQLESEERALSRRRAKLHARIATFPDTTGSWARDEREISKRRREIHLQLDTLRGRGTDTPAPVEQESQRNPA